MSVSNFISAICTCILACLLSLQVTADPKPIESMSITGGSVVWYLPAGDPEEDIFNAVGPDTNLVGGYIGTGGSTMPPFEPPDPNNIVFFTFSDGINSVVTYTAASNLGTAYMPSGVISGGPIPTGTVDETTNTIEIDLSSWFGNLNNATDVWAGTGLDDGFTSQTATGIWDPVTHAYVLSWNSRVPEGPYSPFPGLTSTWTLTGDAYPESSAAMITIDIKPGSDPNSINCKNKGVVPVALIGSTDFDVTQVDISSVIFGPGEASPVKNGHIEDVNGDGFDDLVLHFETQEVNLNYGDTTATLNGEQFDGQQFSGIDTIKALHCGRLIASFADDMRGGGLPHASNTSAGVWIYGWNSVGAIEDPEGVFSWLMPTNDVLFLYDTDGISGLPDNPPGSYTYMGYVDTEQKMAGGHPGQGYEQNEYERYVVALFVLPEDGYYEIQNSNIRLENPSGNILNSDGLSYYVIVVGDQPSTAGIVDPGYLNTGSFDTSLGYNTAGEYVVVAIGSRGNDNYDTFSMDFDIVAVTTQ